MRIRITGWCLKRKMLRMARAKSPTGPKFLEHFPEKLIHPRTNGIGCIVAMLYHGMEHGMRTIAIGMDFMKIVYKGGNKVRDRARNQVQTRSSAP